MEQQAAPPNVGERIKKLHFGRTPLTMEDVDFLVEQAVLGKVFDRDEAHKALKTRVKEVVGTMGCELVRLREELQARSEEVIAPNPFAVATEPAAANNDTEADGA